MYIAAGQGQTTPGDKILMSTETFCHFSHLLQVSKKSLWSLILYIFFFMILYMYIHVAPGQGQSAPRGQSFNVNRNVLSFHSFDASFKKCLWSLILYNLFYDLIHVYSPRAGADRPQGTKFGCQQKGIITLPFVASFKEISLKSDFIHIFSWFNTCI